MVVWLGGGVVGWWFGSDVVVFVVGMMVVDQEGGCDGWSSVDGVCVVSKDW